MKQVYLLLFGLSFLLISCQKEINFDTPPGSGPGGGTGNNYQPTSKDSYWKYRQTGTFSGDYTITSTGQKQTQHGIDFVIFTSTPATTPSQQFFGSKDHNFYTAFEGTSPNTGAPFSINMLYLNDTASVGYSWDHMAGQGNGFTAYTPGIIVEKGISMPVGGKNYNDVIHSQITLEYELPFFGIVPFATYDYYVAKNVGIIRIETTGDPVLAPGVHSIADLIEYLIK